METINLVEGMRMPLNFFRNSRPHDLYYHYYYYYYY